MSVEDRLRLVEHGFANAVSVLIQLGQTVRDLHEECRTPGPPGLLDERVAPSSETVTQASAPAREQAAPSSGRIPPHRGGTVYTVFVAGPGYQAGIYLSYDSYVDAVRDHSVAWNPRGAIPCVMRTVSHSHPNLGAGLQAWTKRFGTDIVAPRFA